eukprot:CAMPEP_0119036090 /NCGR_PEP_ID=MMETSP1177-20130426/3557_1 /TAXON_ID=2985 /ORGANISM="Ochromonas sp, Strain CCMP1899" /LENGTH=67 /DNA_ID=CAMNT_0006995373 /DNA_START=741 /DNA_END=944 /DNA_ORIENTATION=-
MPWHSSRLSGTQLFCGLISFVKRVLCSTGELLLNLISSFKADDVDDDEDDDEDEDDDKDDIYGAGGG